MSSGLQQIKLIDQLQLAVENGDFRAAFRIHKKLGRLFDPKFAFDQEKMHATFRCFMVSVYGIEFKGPSDYA